MKTRITMSISKNEAGLFIVNASDYVLGRQWDNNTTEIEIIKPSGFYDAIRLTMDVYKYDRAYNIHDTSALNKGDKLYYEGLQGIDSIDVRNNVVSLSNHITQYENILIKFIFTDIASGVVKNTDTKVFQFLKSEKPVNFVSYDISPVLTKNGSINLGKGIINYNYSYLGVQDPDAIKISFGSKQDLTLPAAMILMTASIEESAGNIISIEDFNKLANAKITNIVACVPDLPVISISGITYLKTSDQSLIQLIVSDISDTEKPYKLVQLCLDSNNLYSVKSYNLIGSDSNGDTPIGGSPAIYGIPSAYQIPAGGTPTVAQYGDGTEENPYRLQFGLVDGKEGERGIQGRNIRYCGNYVPGTRYYFTDENQDVVSYTAEIIENGFKKIKSVLLYCITTNQKSDTVLFDENGITNNVKDCWALGPVTTSPAGQRFRGDWQPNVVYVNNFEYQDIVRVVQGTDEALLCCVRTNASLSAPNLQNLSEDWKPFIKSLPMFNYAKSVGYTGTQGQFNEKLIKLNDFAERSGGNVFNGNQQISGDLSVMGNIYHYGQSYQTQLEQLNIKNAQITVREDANSALPDNQYAGIKAKHYNNKGDDGYLVFDNRGFAYVGDLGDLQRIATILPEFADNMLLYYNPSTYRIESTGITKEEFYAMKAKCDLLAVKEENGANILEVNAKLKVRNTLDAEGLITSNIGFNKQ